jgi:hypothetical protein
MKRSGIVGALVGAAVLTAGVAPADAGPSRQAARAVERKVERHLDWEHGIDADVAADCSARGGGRYRCWFNFWHGTDSRGLRDLIEGKARVKRSGKRYDIDFRIYW